MLKPQPQPAGTHALWSRVTAVWCLLFCFSLGPVQALHDHDHVFSARRHVAVAPAGDKGGVPEALCPVCTGMHLQPPEHALDLLTAALSRVTEGRVLAVAMASDPLPFALSSRPPPASHLSLL